MREFVLFHTEGCHLCEQAEMLLAPLAEAADWIVELRDIADSDDLLECYGTRIPVLMDCADGRELGWPFGRESVQAWAALSS